MPYKVFDYECQNRDCSFATGSYVEYDVMIDPEKEDPPKCPHCSSEMVQKVGTAWQRHISWSQWNIGK